MGYMKHLYTQLEFDIPEGMEDGWNEFQFEQAAEHKYLMALEVLLQKHHDYGPKNIAQSPGGAINGLRVRMWDKLARINNLYDTGQEAKNESLRDSFLDLANYAIIALMVLDGDWPDGIS
jgi:hypothetical protein